MNYFIVMRSGLFIDVHAYGCIRILMILCLA